MMVVSLRSRLLWLVIVTAFCTCALVSSGLFAFYRFRMEGRKQSTAEMMKARLQPQIDSLLIGYLLPELKAGTNLLLNRIKRDENLSEVRVLLSKAELGDFSGCDLVETTTLCLNKAASQLALVTPIRDGTKTYGFFLKAQTIGAGMTDFFPISAFITVLSLLAFSILFWFLARITSSQIPRTLDHLVKWLEAVLSGNEGAVPPKSQFREFHDLGSRILEIVTMHHAARKENLVLSKQAAIAEFSAQVAHDIRSPLTALDVAVQGTFEMPEENRLLIRRATSRIRDIANHLLSKDRELRFNSLHRDVATIAKQAELVCGLIESIISEKRIQLRSNHIELVADMDSTSYSLFAEVEREQFKRMVSNLIDNAIEAITGRGKIWVSLTSTASSVLVFIRDSGRGISAELLPHVTEAGITFGKATGTGLGLYQVSQCIESWGGKIAISSQVGKGTEVIVTLPRANAPIWFLSEIRILRGNTVVIFDDDKSIHQVWKNRIESIENEDKTVLIVHLYSPTELREYVKANPHKPQLFLVDYEIVGHAITGLDLINELCIRNQSILVTSHNEEWAIIEAVTAMHMRLIPKGMAAFIPLSIEGAHV